MAKPKPEGSKFARTCTVPLIERVGGLFRCVTITIEDGKIVAENSSQPDLYACVAERAENILQDQTDID